LAPHRKIVVNQNQSEDTRTCGIDFVVVAALPDHLKTRIMEPESNGTDANAPFPVLTKLYAREICGRATDFSFR
jgi:hypothetical protein